MLLNFGSGMQMVDEWEMNICSLLLLYYGFGMFDL